MNDTERKMKSSGDFDQVVTNDKIEEAINNIKEYLSSWGLVVIGLCCDCAYRESKLDVFAQRNMAKQAGLRRFNNDYLTNPDPQNRKPTKLSWCSIVRWKFVKAFEIVFDMPIHRCGRSCFW